MHDSMYEHRLYLIIIMNNNGLILNEDYGLLIFSFDSTSWYIKTCTEKLTNTHVIFVL